MSTMCGYFNKVLRASCACVVGLSGTMHPASAEVGVLEEILVTARKVKESVLKVPVTETVITPMQLENLNVTQVTDLPKLVPGLVIGHNVLSNGTTVAIRGVGTVTLDAGVDSTVSFNLDGIPVANGLAFQSSTFDVAQIEVLKGPQALFFGKNSPGGVISVATADPGDQFELMARLGYETEAEGYRGEFVVSGPVSDTLGLRLAAMYSESDGYFKNKAIPEESTGAAAPPSGNEPDAEQYIVRGTALWIPSERFDARVKVNFVHDEASNPTAAQMTNCPDGTAPLVLPPLLASFFPPNNIDFIGGGEDCKLDDTIRVVSYNPEAFPGILNGGHPYSDTDQFFTTAELNYDFTPELALTSVTGWYDLDSDSLVNTQNSSHAAPLLSAAHPEFTNTSFTQELRLTSYFSTPVNFTLGAFYQDAEIRNEIVLMANRATLPDFFWSLIDVDLDHKISIDSYSFFGQLRWRFAPEWELAAGARYTDESRDQDPFDRLTGTVRPHLENNVSDDNISPEVTLTYEASDNLTLFAAYKEGFKSGSFALSQASNPVLDNAFDSEEVQGGELGLKSILMDRTLRFNTSVYYYEYDGLQVGAILSEEGLVGTKTVNAGGTEVYGVEMDAVYLPAALAGLTLNFAVNWNHGRYTDLDSIPCWGGQLISEGCDQILNPETGLYTAQDLSGKQMVRAPDWQGNFGFTYELAMANGYTLEFSNNNSYTDEYPTYLALNRPDNDNYQDSFWKVDLGVTLRGPDDRFEIALIGKNINDEVIGSFCGASPYQAGVGLIPVTIKGGTERGIDGVDENQCFSDPGREIWFRLTYRL